MSKQQVKKVSWRRISRLNGKAASLWASWDLPALEGEPALLQQNSFSSPQQEGFQNGHRRWKPTHLGLARVYNGHGFENCCCGQLPPDLWPKMTLRLGSRVAATPFIGSMSRKTAESCNMLCPEANAAQNGGRQNSCQKRTQSCGKWKQKGTRIHKWDRKSGNKVETRLQKADQRSNEVGSSTSMWDQKSNKVGPKWSKMGGRIQKRDQKTRGLDPEWAPKAGPGKFIFYPYTPSLSCHFSSKTASRYLIVTTRWTLPLQVLAHYAIGSHTPTWRRHLSVIMQAFPKDGAGGADGA